MTQPDFIVIPTQLLSDSSLQPSDRILFGYIYWTTKLALMKCVASNDTLSELTGFSRRGIQQSLVRLEEQGYIRRLFIGKGERHRSEIECLLAFSALKSEKPKTVRTNVRSRTNKRALTVRTNVRHTKSIEEEHIKRSTTNVVGANAPIVYGKPEINDLFSYWKLTTGLEIQSQTQANRRACNTLLKTHGAEGVRKLIDGVALAQTSEFAPRIANFVILQKRLDDLLVWGRSLQHKEENNKPLQFGSKR